MPKNLLKITETEWAEAKAYFAQFPDDVSFVKLSKAGGTKKGQTDDVGTTEHSFIRVNGKIYAMANANLEEEGILGRGDFGTVKLIQTENGTNKAVKIKALLDEEKEGKEVAKLIGFMEDEGVRADESRLDRYMKIQTRSGKTRVKAKSYEILEYQEGSELYEALKILDPQRNAVELYIIAFLCCESLKKVHKIGGIHTDLKPENFMMNREGRKIFISLIDYDTALRLKPGELERVEDIRGSELYLAPEIGKALENDLLPTYSFASDIYALGIMFRDDLHMPEQIYKMMIHDDRAQRPSLEEIKKSLVDMLRYSINLDKTPAYEGLSDQLKEQVRQALEQPKKIVKQFDRQNEIKQLQLPQTRKKITHEFDSKQKEKPISKGKDDLTGITPKDKKTPKPPAA